MSLRVWGGPLLLVGLMFAGAVKSNPRMAWMPVDLTLFCAVLLVAVMVFGAIRLMGRIPVPAPALFGLAAFVPGLALSGDSEYSKTKMVGLALTLIAALAAFYVIRNIQQMRAFIWLLIWFGIILTGLAMSAGLNQDQRLDVEGSNTIQTARVIGVAIVALLCLAMGGTRRRMLKAAMACLLFIPLIQTGSRGPVLAVALAVILVALTRPGLNKAGAVILSAGAIGVGWYVLTSVSGFGAERIKLSLTGQITSTGRRDEIWARALDTIMSTPQGIGFGNLIQTMPTAFDVDGTGRFYAHNVLIEAFVEGGWVLGILVTVWLGWVLLRLRRHAYDPHVAALYGLVVFFLVNALTSGDLNDNRPLWCVAALGSAVILYGLQRDPVVGEGDTDRVDRRLHGSRLRLHV